MEMAERLKKIEGKRIPEHFDYSFCEWSFKGNFKQVAGGKACKSWSGKQNPRRHPCSYFSFIGGNREIEKRTRAEKYN